MTAFRVETKNNASLLTVSCLGLMVGLAISFFHETIAQLPLRYQFTGGFPQDRIAAVCVIGDIDGDNCDDFVYGAPGIDNGGISTTGAAVVVSGRTGVTVFSYLGAGFNESVGSAVSGIGDVDLDGIPDFVICALGANNFFGTATIYSGASGAPIHVLSAWPLGNIGRACAAAGDVNLDGYPDVIVGGDGGAVVFSGADGSIIHVFLGWQSGDHFGYAVAGGGDVDGDGVPDLVVGGAFYGTLNGRVGVYSGSNGLPLYTLTGQLVSAFGASVGILPDRDGDGRDEFMVGAFIENNDGGVLRIYSGSNSSLQLSIPGIPAHQVGAIFVTGSWLGCSLSLAGDVDRDGICDVLVGGCMHVVGTMTVGMARVLSGVDGSEVFTWYGTQNDERMGNSVAGGGDLDGDGFMDCVVSAPLYDPSPVLQNAGRVQVISPFGIRRYSGSSVPASSLDLSWQIGQGLDPALGTVSVAGAPPFAPGVVALSLGLADTTISGVPLLVDASPSRLFSLEGISFDANGNFVTPALIRYPAIAGTNIRAQVFSLALPYVASNGLEIRLLP